jgi:TRAP-type mannitol/chloroaromatic compound transport system permease small subunit
MPKLAMLYVKHIDALNRKIGYVSVYLVFAIIIILLTSTVSRYVLDKPVIWGVEMAQFAMAVYYTLGGAFALLLNSHVRMDLLYARWGVRKRARMDVVTFICLVAYLGLLSWGGLSSTAYSVHYHQHNNTAWGPPISPVKILLVIGIFLTFLQAISEFIKDIARAKGLEVAEVPELEFLETNSSEKSSSKIDPGQPTPVPLESTLTHQPGSFVSSF